MCWNDTLSCNTNKNIQQEMICLVPTAKVALVEHQKKNQFYFCNFFFSSAHVKSEKTEKEFLYIKKAQWEQKGGRESNTASLTSLDCCKHFQMLHVNTKKKVQAQKTNVNKHTKYYLWLIKLHTHKCLMYASVVHAS